MAGKESKTQNNRIVLTGGGSTGHVTVNLSLIPVLLQDGWEITYAGSNGIEKELVSGISGVDFYEISAGKVRRYLSAKNVADLFRVLKGCLQAIFLLHKVKPAIVFAKGGYVSFPIVFGAWVNRIPSVLHESDLTPGLANKAALPFSSTICLTFPETKEYLSEKTCVVECGPIIRADLKTADKCAGKKMCRFSDDKPILLVVGGSLGAQEINDAVWQNRKKLLARFNIIHISGTAGQRFEGKTMKGYCHFAYVKEGFPDLIAASDVIVTRAGANAIFEFLYMRKPMVLVPLPASRSRGDQIQNAKNFEKRGLAKVVDNSSCVSGLVDAVFHTYDHRYRYLSAIEMYNLMDSGLENLYDTIKSTVRKR